MHVARLFADQPPFALAQIQAYLVFSSLKVELQIRADGTYQTGNYHQTLHDLIRDQEQARDQAIDAARRGELTRCSQIVESANSPLLRIFSDHGEALAHVNLELSALDGTRFNDIYSEACFGPLGYIGIYMEAS